MKSQMWNLENLSSNQLITNLFHALFSISSESNDNCDNEIRKESLTEKTTITRKNRMSFQITENGELERALTAFLNIQKIII